MNVRERIDRERERERNISPNPWTMGNMKVRESEVEREGVWKEELVLILYITIFTKL